MDLPAPLLARAASARRVVEVGSGVRFELALALADAAPRAQVMVTDVDPRVLRAPVPLLGVVDDVTQPHLARFAGVDLVYSVRLPEELQLACARFADALGADLALRPLKDEWADVSAARRRLVHWPEGWRFFPAPSRSERECS